MVSKGAGRPLLTLAAHLPGIVLAAQVLLFSPAPALAQQRNRAFELYGLTGGYFHGNLSASHEWKPQAGGGVLAPLGRNWAVLFDVTTSAVDGDLSVDGFRAPDSGNFVKERRVMLVPSAVRMWRRDRFSIYAGAGWAYEHERQHYRIRPIVGREADDRAILGPPTEGRARRTDAMLALRFGGLVSLTPKIVFRAGFSLLPRYIDEAASKSMEVGIGYRF